MSICTTVKVVLVLGGLSLLKGTATAASPKVEGGLPLAAQHGSLDRQCRSDIEVLTEFLWRNGDPPSEDTVKRMIQRAKVNPQNAELLYWAGYCGLRMPK